MNAFMDFMSAALPWLCMGLLLALFFVINNRKEKKKKDENK